MKNVSIFHGHNSTPQSFWHPWLKQQLKKEGYSVWLPQLPDTQTPELKKWHPYALQRGTFDQDTVLIGHSCGCPLILSILETIEITIKESILVAGFIEPLKDKPDPILQDQYDWRKIQRHCREFITINSDNDPWGCNDKMGRKIFDQVGGMFIIRHGDGHMGSETFKQTYREFPLLLKLVED